MQMIYKIRKVKDLYDKTRFIQQPANQPAMQINWLIVTQCEPKTRREFRTDQSINNTCDFMMSIK